MPTIGERLQVAGYALEELVEELSAGEFDPRCLKNYDYRDELQECCQRAVAELCDEPYLGRASHAKVMGLAMERLQDYHDVKAPGGWYPIMKRLRSSSDSAAGVSPSSSVGARQPGRSSTMRTSAQSGTSSPASVRGRQPVPLPPPAIRTPPELRPSPTREPHVRKVDSAAGILPASTARSPQPVSAPPPASRTPLQSQTSPNRERQVGKEGQCAEKDKVAPRDILADERSIWELRPDSTQPREFLVAVGKEIPSLMAAVCSVVKTEGFSNNWPHALLCTEAAIAELNKRHQPVPEKLVIFYEFCRRRVAENKTVYVNPVAEELRLEHEARKKAVSSAASLAPASTSPGKGATGG